MTEPVKPPDPDRRRFFRQFAGEVVTSVGSALGAVQTLQETSADAARELLGVAGPSPAQAARASGLVAAQGVPVGGTRLTTAGLEQDADTAGWRAPFRWDGDVCLIVDQRRLPRTLVDLELRGAADTVNAINDGALVGAPVQAQVAAVTIAILAHNGIESRAFARRATIRGGANALRNTRPASAALSLAVERMVALQETMPIDAPGADVAAALKDEAERIIGEAIDEHGALVGHLVGALPGGPEDPLHLMVLGSTGAMGGGQFGTALSGVQTLHHAGRPVHALLPEARPGLEGSRIAAWELKQAGVPHAIVTDAAAPGCVGAGEVDAVLVGAERICANGDVVTTPGGYALAIACAAAEVPFIVCAPTAAVDLSIADGGDAVLEEGRPTLVLRVGTTELAPSGTQVRNPLQDMVPARFVSAIVTETGVLREPFGPSLAEAWETAARRRAGAPGFAALMAQRSPAPARADDTAAPAPDAAAAPDDALARDDAAAPDDLAPDADDAGALGPTGRTVRPPMPDRDAVDVAALRNPPRGGAA